jgi:signal transduction histidine kinase
LSFTKPSLRARAFRSGVFAGTLPVVAPVILGGAAVFALACPTGLRSLAGPAIALLVAATVAEAFPVPIERVSPGETSFANVFIVTAAIMYGWECGVVIGVLSMLVVELVRRAPAVRLAFNSSLYGLAAAAAGLSSQATPERYRIGLLGALAFYVVDVALLGAAISRARKRSYLRVAVAFFRSTLAPFVVMATTTAVLVRLWADSPWWSLLLAPPLVAIGLHQRSLLATVARQRELDRMKDEFMAVISHELRTPLTSVYGAAVTLEERELDEDMRRRLIGVIRRESTRQTKVISDVLWASKLDANKAAASPKACDVVQIAREVATTAAEAAPESVSIVVDADPLPTVSADPEHLRLVLTNLLDNAIKYSPEGGAISLAVRNEGDRVRLSVSDEGLGIDPDDRERIFEKFTRLDPDMRLGIGGTGLGLYICRRLVEQMHGRLSVTGNGGRGTTFVFEIPTTTEEGGNT